MQLASSCTRLGAAEPSYQTNKDISVNVIVAVDLDIEAQDIEAIAAVATGGNWEITLLHVVSPPPVFFQSDFGGFLPPGPVETDGAEARLEGIAEAFRSYDLAVEPLVTLGDPVFGICEAAKACDVAMIVAVARHHSLAHRVVQGSVVSGLVKSSPRPVLLIPELARRASGLDCAVDRLVEVADRHDKDVDLTGVHQALEAHRANPDAEEHHSALREALEDLVLEHPDLVIAANNVSFYIRTIGI